VSAIVEVLLSTYNGERYLPELLDSVQAQDYTDLSVSARDDGSTDATVALLEERLSGRSGDRLAVGPYLGAAQSFMTLLRDVRPASSFAGFCDQDDVWAPEKISVAVTALQGLEKEPAMYCSAVCLVGEDLSEIKVHRRCVNGPSFDNALVENIATGCTIMLNRPAIDLLAARSPRDLVMHDAWCYLVVAGCGTVVYDPEPHVRYRLHSSNAIGVGRTPWAEWSGRAWRQLTEGSKRVLTCQAEELQQLYGSELRPGAARSLQEFLASEARLASRARYVLGGAAHRQRLFDDLVFRALYVLHRV